MGMASNQPPSSSKITNAPAQTSSPVSQSGSGAGVDSAQRRTGGSGSFGAGASARTAGSTPRKQQISKNHHKQSRRYRLTDEDAVAESAAMRSFTNKKGQTSITHLMNFSLPPRPSYRDQYGPGHRHARRNPTWGLGSGHHAVDKARYVHANYRFIVDPRKDYQAQSIDADVYLDWSTILQVIASPQSQNASCPICLGEPTAPRMAKCGHIFCLHCLIRYMHSTEESDSVPEKKPRWKKCPICWDSVYISETRPVRWYVGQEGPPPIEGGDIVLRLVMRPAGSTLALPKDSSTPLTTKDGEIPWHFAADAMDYARVMKGTEDYMLEQHEIEITAIRTLEKHDELMFGEDTEWTGKAIRSIQEQKEKVKGIGNSPKQPKKPEEPKVQRKPIVFNENDDDVPAMYSLRHEAQSLHHHSSSSSNTPSGLSDASSAVQTPAAEERGAEHNIQSALSTSLAQFKAQHGQHAPPSDYYFYQALLHYYLSPLDIRILKAAFGDFSTFPSTILPRVERISTGHVIDDDLRKRTKYLAHLPHGCEVSFLECDWTDTVAPDILEKFKPDIEKRRKRNLEKSTREEKERVRAEKEEEDKRYALARRIRRPNSPTERFKPDDFQPLGADAAESVGSTEAGGQAMSPVWSGRKTEGSSYATLASPSTSPTHARTVWGTTAITPTSPELLAAQELGPVDDGWLQGWENDLMREDDLIAQVAAASLNGESSSSAVPAPPLPSAGAGKKKKGKKITLMSTNARRGA